MQKLVALAEQEKSPGFQPLLAVTAVLTRGFFSALNNYILWCRRDRAKPLLLIINFRFWSVEWVEISDESYPLRISGEKYH